MSTNIESDNEVENTENDTAPATVSRRDFLRGVGGTSAGLAIGGAGVARYGTDSAQALVPAVAAMGLIAYGGYVVGKSKNDHDTGPDRDLSGYQGGDSLHAAQEEDVLELKGTEEEVLTGVRNIIERGEVAATMDGKKAFIEAYNAGDTKSECQNAAEAAVDDFWGNREQSTVTRWSQACRMIERRLTEVESNSDLDKAAVWNAIAYEDNTYDSINYQDTPDSSSFEDRTYETFNGTSITYRVPHSSSQTQSEVPHIDPFGSRYHGEFEFTKYSDGATVTALSTQKYVQIMDRIATARDRTIGNMATYVDESFDALERGEISTDDLLNHYDIQQEFSTNKEDTGYHGWLAWEFYALGMEADLQHNAVLSFPEDDDSTQLEGTLFVSSAEPIGGKIEAGTTYDPSQWGGESAYFTYERIVNSESAIGKEEEIAKEHDDGTYTVIGKAQLEDKFTVEKLYNAKTGEETDSTTTEKTNDQNYDPTELQNEIDRLNEKITEMQENAEAERSGGGGGGGPDISWWQGLGVGGILLAVLYALSAGQVGQEPPNGGQ